VPERCIGRSLSVAAAAAAGGMCIGEEKRRSRVWGWASFRKPAVAGGWREGGGGGGAGGAGGRAGPPPPPTRKPRHWRGPALFTRRRRSRRESGAGSCPTRSRRCGNRRGRACGEIDRRRVIRLFFPVWIGRGDVWTRSRASATLRPTPKSREGMNMIRAARLRQRRCQQVWLFPGFCFADMLLSVHMERPHQHTPPLRSVRLG
jgi:hypothetical protein